VKNKKFITAILLLLLTLSAAAQDTFIQRGCRRGVMPAPTRSHRAADVSQRVGGDFYQGDRRQLVVLVSFTDLQFSDSDPMTAWNRIFNETNYTEAPFYGSFYDYFLAQSNGEFRLKFDLLYVALNQSRVKYRSTGMTGNDENSQYLVNDLVDVLQTRDIDWSLYDWNGDGYVNQLMIIYPGYGQNDGGDDNSIWPHQYWLSWHWKDYNKTHQTTVHCEPRQVSSAGKSYLIDCYCALQEFANSKKYGSFGTICHEYTHCFGFPDFYGTSDSPREWDLMDYGNNNGEGFCPPNYSAHERWLMGWGSPTVLNTSTTISTMDQSLSYLIRNDGHSDEYYIVENRQQTGWDQALPSSGLVVFHIDYDESTWISSWPNTNNKKRYRIIPANNKPDYSPYSTSNQKGWPYPYQVNDSLTNNSTPAASLNNPNADGTYFMNKSLRDIKVENGLASFRFTVDSATGIEELRDPQSYQILYDLGPIYIIRYSNGEIKKVVKR